MPMILEEQQEQQEKRESTFLKYESENILIILSNLYKIDSHYVKSINKFVACHKDNCQYCDYGLQKKAEYNYLVNLNGKEGIMDIKPSIFFNINAIERISKKDKRHISWMVIKTGSGLETEYTVSKDDNLTSEDIEKTNEKLEENNKKLAKIMIEREKRLEEEFKKNLKEADIEERGDDSSKYEGLTKDEEEVVNPDDVPF